MSASLPHALEQELSAAAARLRSVLEDPSIMTECRIEIWDAMDDTLEALEVALGLLKAAGPPRRQPPAPGPGAPTRQQGQFLAFIREYIAHNYAGIAPSHAEFQRFFNLTPPSVNSMLIRLEQKGFIRRVPYQARAIQLTIPEDQIPALERPLKF